MVGALVNCACPCGCTNRAKYGIPECFCDPCYEFNGACHVRPTANRRCDSTLDGFRCNRESHVDRPNYHVYKGPIKGGAGLVYTWWDPPLAPVVANGLKSVRSEGEGT